MNSQPIRRSATLVAAATIFVMVAGTIATTIVSKQSHARILHYESILVQAPCIGAVCPGMEGRSRLKEYLADDPNIGLISDNGPKRISFSFANQNPKAFGNDAIGGGALVFSEDSQGGEQILESAFYDLYDLRFGTIIDVLGEPERYLYVSGCGMGNRMFGVFLYPSIHTQVIVSYETRRPSVEYVSAETPIEGLQFSTAASYETQLLDTLNTAVLESVAFDLRPDIDSVFLLDQFQPWPGMDTTPTASVDLCPR